MLPPSPQVFAQNQHYGNAGVALQPNYGNAGVALQSNHNYGNAQSQNSAANGGGSGIPLTYQCPSSRPLKKQKSDDNNPMHYN